MEGTWGGTWGPPAPARGLSDGQAQAKQSAWGKSSPTGVQPQAHLQPSTGQPVPGLAGGASDSMPSPTRLDQTVVGRGLPPVSPQRSPATSLVMSPLSLPAVPSGPLPGALPSALGGMGAPVVPPVIMTAAKVVAAGAALGGASADGGGRHVVRCKGLPFSATVASVASFFEPLVPPQPTLPHSGACQPASPPPACPHLWSPAATRCRWGRLAACVRAHAFQHAHLLPLTLNLLAAKLILRALAGANLTLCSLSPACPTAGPPAVNFPRCKAANLTLSTNLTTASNLTVTTNLTFSRSRRSWSTAG
jgi:hypothetical protein